MSNFVNKQFGLHVSQPSVSKKAYVTMEWYRYPVNTKSDAVPRFEAFPAWSALVCQIALCVPSSAAVERVFLLLKLALSKLNFNKLKIMLRHP